MHLYLLVSGQKDKDVDFVQISPPSNWISTFPVKLNTLLTQRLLSANVYCISLLIATSQLFPRQLTWKQRATQQLQLLYSLMLTFNSKWLFNELLTWGIKSLINTSAAPRECCCYTLEFIKCELVITRIVSMDMMWVLEHSLNTIW